MATGTTFDTHYGVTPWADVETKEETVFVPELLEVYRSNSMFFDLVSYGVNLGAARTGEMVFTQVYDPEPNIATLDNRAIWLPQIYIDSRQLRITALRYGDEYQMHKYDEMITYWKENGIAGLRNIIQSRVAPHLVESLDLLARNAFLEKSSVMFAGGASDFGSVEADDLFDPGVVRAVWLDAEYSPDPVTNPIIGITSPSAVYTMKDATAGEFLTRMTYAEPMKMVNREIGTYQDVRFAQSSKLTLWNCGEVLHQTTITAAVSRGDGAPDPDTTEVDGVWEVGQGDATHYISVADASDFVANEKVTLHQTRPAADATMAVEDGVVWNHAKKIDLDIYSVDTGNNRITFKKPILVDWFDTIVSGAIYGYVTKARPIHVTLFLKGPRGVVGGVLAPPQTYSGEPIDITKSIYRFGWDAYLKYQIMYPERFEVYFHAGPIRQGNAIVNL